MIKGWEKPVCPICASRRYLVSLYTGITTWEYPGAFSFVRCTQCSLVMQSPRVLESRVGQYYKNTLYWGDDLKCYKTTDWHTMRAEHYGPIYKLIDQEYKTPGSILDVGCGLGLFLSYYREKGWKTLGTEFVADVATFAKKTFGVTVLLGQLENFKITQQFDVIVFSGVFEHLYHPDKVLQAVAKLLKPKGLVIIIPPNINSLGHAIFKNKWHSLEPGRHVFHYSPQTITQLLHQAGFEVLGIRHNHMTHNVYGLFTSLRFLHSPKFNKSKATGSVHAQRREWGKFVGRLFAWAGARLEAVLQRGESMLVYARHLS